MIERTITWLMVGILFAIASVFFGAMQLTTNTINAKNSLINYLTPTPKGRHRRY